MKRGGSWNLTVHGPDWKGFYATSEMIHQVIKNRVQEQIEAQFPELADAAKEQMV